MDSQDASLRFAAQMEEGRADPRLEARDEKSRDLPSPTSSGPTLVSRASLPVRALKSVRTWPESIATRVSDAWPQKDEFNVQKLEDFPLGYPRVSRFLDSDDSFMIYRRFGTLQARLLLRKQDQLRKLEDQLKAMDAFDDESEAGRQCLASRMKDEAMQPEYEGGETRDQLLDRIEKKHLEYGQLLMQAQALVSMNKPASRDQRSVVRFLDMSWTEFDGQERKNLAKPDNRFIYEREDLVSLKTGRENAWLDAMIERAMKYLHCRPIEWAFCNEETRRKTHDGRIHYYARERVNTFVTFIITALILLLLVVPIWVLFYISANPKLVNNPSAVIISILLVATLIFSSVLSAFTKAKRHEILAAAAG